MKEIKFRNLNANEIDVRIGTQKLEDPQNKKSRVVGACYLLYKDARVDMNLLDETVGNMNWQRHHEFKEGKLYCTVSIWDDEKKQWVSKEDVGVESDNEAEKGQASDSFKRVCVNVGIGRELYTAPFIWVNAKPSEDLRKVKMFVEEIGYNAKNEIDKLLIVDEDGNVRYSLNIKPKQTSKKETKSTSTDVINREIAITKLNELGITMDMLVSYLGKNAEDISVEEINTIIEKKLRKNAKANI